MQSHLFQICTFVVFVFWSSHNHTPIKHSCPVKKITEFQQTIPRGTLDANSSKPFQSQGPHTFDTAFEWKSRALTITWSQSLVWVWSGPKVCGHIEGIFQLHKQFCPLAWLGNCLIWPTIVNHFRIKVEMQKIHEIKNRFLFSLSDRTCTLSFVDNKTYYDVYILSTQSNLKVIACIYLCLVQESYHRRPASQLLNIKFINAMTNQVRGEKKNINPFKCTHQLLFYLAIWWFMMSLFHFVYPLVGQRILSNTFMTFIQLATEFASNCQFRHQHTSRRESTRVIERNMQIY